MVAKLDSSVISFREQEHAGKAARIVQRIFRDYPGSMAVRLGKSETLTFGKGTPIFTLAFNNMSMLRILLLNPDPIKFAHTYFAEQAEIEGDIYAALSLREYLDKLEIPVMEKMSLWFSALTMNGSNAVTNEKGPSWVWDKPGSMEDHGRAMNREAIGFHYDVSNEFYKLWLDERMLYSCAYFENSQTTLAQAQANKLDLICRKLRLQPGERLLDIGCGWGALVMWAARHYGVKAHGITLSQNQYEYAKARIQAEGLQDQITIELRDYRDLQGENVYDKVSSVGMFEHVGLKNLPVYYEVVQRVLKPGGLFLNHGITQDVEGGTESVGAAFIAKYVFPDGELDRVSNIQLGMEEGGFEISDVESMRAHYALTLRHWVTRLEERHEDALKYVSEAVYRIWRLYMAGCALQFENGELGIYQVLAAKRVRKLINMPLSRAYMTQQNPH